MEEATQPATASRKTWIEPTGGYGSPWWSETAPTPAAPVLGGASGKEPAAPSFTPAIELVRRPLKRDDTYDVAPLMGKCERNPFSGHVSIPQAEKFDDFSVVDLWTRPKVDGTMEQLLGDPFLFRPVPLTYRTWLYHYDYLHNTADYGLDSDEYSMLRRALSYECVDAPTSAGRWSPVVALACLAVVATLTGDIVAYGLPLLMTVVGRYAAILLFNTARTYRLFRPITFLPRIGFYLLLIAKFFSTLAGGGAHGLAVMGYLLALAIAGQDVVRGDLAMVRNYGLHCAYDITHVLPNRILICRRRGAAFLEEQFGSRGALPETITGLGRWDPSHTLIAEVQGLIMELLPMQQEDWKRIFEQVLVHRETASFLAMDVFSDKLPTAAAVSEDMRGRRPLEEQARDLPAGGDANLLE